VFDHENHFEHLAIESEYALLATTVVNENSDPEAPPTLGRTLSQGSFVSEANIGYAFSSANLATLSKVGSGTRLGSPASSYSAKLESMAAAAVKTADKVGAALIVVLTHTGKSASLVAKYRPQQPIMTLVVPFLKRDGMKWVLEGRSTARQSLITYGLMPVLAAPAPSAGEGLIEEAVVMAVKNGIVKANDHIVVLSRTMSNEFMLKVVTVDGQGGGILNIRPKSLMDLLKATGQHVPDEDTDLLAARPSILLGRQKDPLVVKPHELKSNGGVANGGVTV
jgi:hypothetical protein